MKRAGALARRYGHSAIASAKSAVSTVRRVARENAPVTAAVIGAGAGALIAGLGAGPAAVVGAVAAVAVEEGTKR